MTAFKVLSFDLDDTLWPVGPAILAAEKAVIDWLHREYPRALDNHNVESMRALRASMAQRHPHRQHDMTFLRRAAIAEQLNAAGYGEEGADAAFEVFFAARNRVQLYPDVEPALQRLQRRYRLYALSNGNANLQRCGIDRYFAGHISAQSAGVAKPDARIFAALADDAGVNMNEVLHIGDDPLADVDGAVRSGMHAVWVRREPREWPMHLDAPTRIIASLQELD